MWGGVCETRERGGGLVVVAVDLARGLFYGSIKTCFGNVRGSIIYPSILVQSLLLCIFGLGKSTLFVLCTFICRVLGHLLEFVFRI